jgi:putative ABC transport system permease protein
VLGARRTVGSAARGTVTLGVLVCGCVFAAVAGPALSLHTRTQALQQDLASLGNTTKSVQVSGDWSDFVSGMPQAQVGGPTHNLTLAQLGDSTREIARGLAATPLPLAGGDWVGLSTKTLVIASPVPASAMADGAGSPPRLEVVYRDPITAYAQVVAGTYSTAGVPGGAVPVAVTTQTAARFGLHPGSRVQLTAPSGLVELDVTAIVAERDPGSTFWTQDITVGMPSLVMSLLGEYWVGGVLVDPGALAVMQNAFGGPGLSMLWEFPLSLGGVNADQVQGLSDDVERALSVTPALGQLVGGTGGLTATSPVGQDLSAFVDTQAATQTVLLLLFVSMIVVGVAVVLVASLGIAVRREGELGVLRARGGSLRQVGGLMLRGTAVAVVPAAVAGAGLALVLVPGTPGRAQSVSWVLGWVLAGAAVLAALAGPPLIGVWRHRRPAPAANPARVTTAETSRSRVASLRRPVAEVTACAAAVAGLVVLHDEGVPAGGSVDWFLAAAPVLVAVLAVVVMLRLYPLVIRGLLRLSARRAGATGFVALAGAARTSLTGVLPAFALVLALSLATFAGALRTAIGTGEVAASWQATGADVMITTGPGTAPATPAAVAAIAAVPGVRHVAAVWVSSWVTSFGQPLTVVAVDPASYQAVVAGTPFPAVPVSAISVTSGGPLSPATTVPVLASPAEAAALGGGVTRITSLYPPGQVSVRIAGQVAGTPAQPGGGAFLVMPQRGLTGLGSLAAANMVLVTGSSINEARLSAVVAAQIPGALTRFRSAVLAGLVNSPLQHGAVLVVTLTVAAATGFGLFILVLGLALGTADRELTLARLTVMGHERATGFVLAEVMPAVLAAVLAGAVCALVLPHLIGSALDLSGFTGAGIAVQLQPDLAALALPAAFFLLIAAVALVTQTRALRRRGVTGILRAN